MCSPFFWCCCLGPLVTLIATLATLAALYWPKPITDVAICYVNGCGHVGTENTLEAPQDLTSCARTLEYTAWTTGSAPLYMRLRMYNPNRLTVNAESWDVALAEHDTAQFKEIPTVLAVGRKNAETYDAVFDDEARRVVTCVGEPFEMKKGDVDVNIGCDMHTSSPATSTMLSTYANGTPNTAIARVQVKLNVFGKSLAPVVVVMTVPMLPPTSDLTMEGTAKMAMEAVLEEISRDAEATMEALEAQGEDLAALEAEATDKLAIGDSDDLTTCPGTSDVGQLASSPTVWVCGLAPFLPSMPGEQMGMAVELEILNPTSFRVEMETLVVDVAVAGGGPVVFSGTMSNFELASEGVTESQVVARVTEGGVTVAAGLFAGEEMSSSFEVHVTARLRVLGLELNLNLPPTPLPMGGDAASGSGVFAALALARGDCICVGGCTTPAAIAHEVAKRAGIDDGNSEDESNLLRSLMGLFSG